MSGLHFAHLRRRSLPYGCVGPMVIPGYWYVATGPPFSSSSLTPPASFAAPNSPGGMNSPRTRSEKDCASLRRVPLLRPLKHPVALETHPTPILHLSFSSPVLFAAVLHSGVASSYDIAHGSLRYTVCKSFIRARGPCTHVAVVDLEDTNKAARSHYSAARFAGLGWKLFGWVGEHATLPDLWNRSLVS